MTTDQLPSGFYRWDCCVSGSQPFVVVARDMKQARAKAWHKSTVGLPFVSFQPKDIAVARQPERAKP